MTARFPAFLGFLRWLRIQKYAKLYWMNVERRISRYVLNFAIESIEKL